MSPQEHAVAAPWSRGRTKWQQKIKEIIALNRGSLKFQRSSVKGSIPIKVIALIGWKVGAEMRWLGR